MKQSRRDRGFTIIEVLIVMAIGGLIVLILFLAVPALRRVERDTSRKHFAELVFGVMNEQVNNEGLQAPDDPVAWCRLFDQYVSESNPGMDACVPVIDGTNHCVLVTGGRFTLCYHELGSPHNFMGEYDVINIQNGHICGVDPLSTDYPLQQDGPTDFRPNIFTIWTRLEGGGTVLCLSNRGKKSGP